MPLDEAIPVMFVYLTRNLNKDDREEQIRELDAPIVWVAAEDDDRTVEEKEDDEVFRILGLPGLRAAKRPSPGTESPA